MNEFTLNNLATRPSQRFAGRLFRVPDYQRGYAWQTEQLNEFLEDLELLPKGSVHYTGNLVLHCADGLTFKDKAGNTYSTFDIVDGHPRHPEAFSDFVCDVQLRGNVVTAAERLPRLGVIATFLPLLIAFRLKRPGKAAVYLLALNLCERYAFRVYRFLERRPYTGRPRLLSFGHWLYSGSKTTNEILLEFTALILEHSPDTRVEEAYAFKADADWYRWTGLKYFLYEYEVALDAERNKNLKISWKQLETLEHTIEHILPQNPIHEYWLSRWTEEQRKMYTHDIGNLCLTLDNSSYGRKSFHEKRGVAGSKERCYATGDLVMERDLAAFADWDEQTLLKRREAIVEWAKGRWGMSN